MTRQRKLRKIKFKTSVNFISSILGIERVEIAEQEAMKPWQRANWEPRWIKWDKLNYSRTINRKVHCQHSSRLLIHRFLKFRKSFNSLIKSMKTIKCCLRQWKKKSTMSKIAVRSPALRVTGMSQKTLKSPRGQVLSKRHTVQTAKNHGITLRGH